MYWFCHLSCVACLHVQFAGPNISWRPLSLTRSCFRLFVLSSFRHTDVRRVYVLRYQQMMDQYPESMGSVLMLYIDAQVNGHSIQAFVDSGAQATIMSAACADRCWLLRLLDTRFAGTAVGVGTGKILGRVHVAPIKIKDHFFPCSITIMDSEKGLGDKNMDFLFGLDMLKRHRCKIDLEINSLFFSLDDGAYLEAPFLHEKDLVMTKGGTKGFDAAVANEELQRIMEESIRKQMEKEDGNVEDDESKKKKNKVDGSEDDAMDVDEDRKKWGW